MPFPGLALAAIVAVRSWGFAYAEEPAPHSELEAARAAGPPHADRVCAEDATERRGTPPKEPSPALQSQGPEEQTARAQEEAPATGFARLVRLGRVVLRWLVSALGFVTLALGAAEAARQLGEKRLDVGMLLIPCCLLVVAAMYAYFFQASYWQSLLDVAAVATLVALPALFMGMEEDHEKPD
eukprot:CAMPEP_0117514716 /NCGR_PEP_ID=MMETSP0784-20121206/30211_1 /TAXON_ID=39447 /ORGANISM="" /LENGTH=182 /DNA_ID=CAMNT_0005310517 /DNA_START=1 /DNA_END=549 /DNA_ORIENTATION=+